jgi:Tol biopolymer transport system component
MSSARAATTSVVLLAMLWLATASASAAVDRRAIFWGEGPSGFGIYESNSDGSSPRLIGSNNESFESISPDGRLVAWDDNHRIYVSDISGAHRRMVYGGITGHNPIEPRFSPDGTKLIFGAWWAVVREGVVTQSFHVDTIDLDGLNFRVLSEEGSFWSDPTYSPDQRTIAYATAIDPEGEPPGSRLVVANADGSEPVAITAVETLEYVGEPRFSPDGRHIVFSGAHEETEWEIFTIDVDGRNLTQLTSFEEFTMRPEWTPDGNNIVFQGELESGWLLYTMTAEGSGIRPFQPAEDFESTAVIAFPQRSTIVDDDDYLGATFQPLLQFDSDEPWRPLDVPKFFEENKPGRPEDSYNEMCNDELGCYALTNWRSVLMGAAVYENPHIKMGIVEEEEIPRPTTPYLECLAGGLVDCDTGPRAATYYHVVPSAAANNQTEAGYNYVDYWSLYRYNESPGEPTNIGDHEGDWEGITIAPSLENPRSFDLAIFAQHDGSAVYAAETLTCDEGGEGSCGEGEGPIGQRVWDFVAFGTHAAYPEEDDGGESRLCFQDSSILLDGCHDGAAPWGANHEVANLVHFPPVADWNREPENAWWVNWPGKWGGSDSSPDSPGNQDRFTCPWEASPLDETACPSRIDRPSAAAARNAAVSRCDNWFGEGVVATVCAPGRLRRAVHSGQVGRHGDLRLRLRGQQRKTASVNGVAQMLGTPLRPGQSLSLHGHAPRGAQLLVRARAGRYLLTARFEHLGLVRGRQGALRVGSAAGRPTLTWKTPDGRVVEAAASRTTKMPRAWSRAMRHRDQAERDRSNKGESAHRAAAQSRSSSTCKAQRAQQVRSLARAERRARAKEHPAHYHRELLRRAHC